MKWSVSEKGKLGSATKLLNNVSDNITLDDFLSSTKLVILLVFEDASTAVTWVNLLACQEVGHVNEVKIRWKMPVWHIPSIINVRTKYGEPRLYGNGETDPITKTWSKVSRPWKWGQAQVTHFWMSYLPSMINVWTKYSEPRLYGNLKIDLIAKTWQV